MINKTLLSILGILAMFNCSSQGQKHDTLIRLGVNALFVANIDVLSNEYDGICDCSIGNKKRKNECSLFKIKMNNLIFQADSVRFPLQQLYELDSVIINEKLKSKLIVGQKCLVVLGITSSDKYLQIIDILDDKMESRYKFSQFANLTSINCARSRQTIKRK